MRRLVRERCDHVVSLPLFGHVTSLNVSVVAGIALYDAFYLWARDAVEEAHNWPTAKGKKP